MAVCPRCKKRLAKRACPALGRSICQLCCGNLREKEIPCPPSCVHLAAHKSYQQKRIMDRRPAGPSARPRSKDDGVGDERLGWLGFHVEATLVRYAAAHPDFSDADALTALDDARGKIEKEPPRLIMPGEAVRSANEAGELVLKAAAEFWACGRFSKPHLPVGHSSASSPRGSPRPNPLRSKKSSSP
jgi:hypothetical protein